MQNHACMHRDISMYIDRIRIDNSIRRKAMVIVSEEKQWNVHRVENIVHVMYRVYRKK